MEKKATITERNRTLAVAGGLGQRLDGFAVAADAVPDGLSGAGRLPQRRFLVRRPRRLPGRLRRGQLT